MKSESTLDFDKAIVHNKMNICLKFTHPQTIQNVDEFVSYSEQVWREIKHYITHQILCSEWVPSEWESKQLIENFTIVHN